MQDFPKDNDTLSDDDVAKLQAAEKFARMFQAHAQNLMLTRLETNSLPRIMLEAFGADRSSAAPKLYGGNVLYYQRRSFADKSNTITMSPAAQRNISVEVPAITTSHLDKRWLMPVMQACDETWMATGDIINAWITAADKADEMNIQI
ncbi:hypothetical protein D6C78_02357 [Aureobasidium pullulans]|uniref:Uncharacterized protein n=1 Tax=Aureobasidium pullulans TaxID=5580 RepID=A0A4T0ACV2_AURPU|nr:hypothetical protein D6D28_06116 [Aureobasidium pullulans]THY18368.1 hypothetical protein D6D00_08155 [Aureobasidium pullulans]THY96719.1 hypothetical protein D6C92_03765 [Aureobasidium pullulans]TIA18071.1 hypothetical protein D6C81_05256 [Aureobasidium pullulans]TIA40654.1 hypothetical protein D6C78_02357 [Aureobasidium pullulans]